MDALSGVRFGPLIAAAASRHHLDSRLLAAVAAQETGGPGSDSGANVIGDGGHGHGVFQIDDRYHAFAQTPAAMDPAANSEYAAGLLSSLLARYDGNVRAALSAYNAGSPEAAGTITVWPDGARLGYADSVLRHLASLDGHPLATQDPAPQGAAAAGGTATLPPSVLDMLAGLVPQISSTIPPLQPFRSYASDLQAGGGVTGDDADKRMAGLIAPDDSADQTAAA